MTKSRSTKPSGGNAHIEKRRRFRSTFYLDADICGCAEIISVLDKLSVPYEQHLKHFERGTPDIQWMALPGAKNWAVLTKDKSQRFIPLERENIIQFRLGRFAFSSGSLTGSEMAEMLTKHLTRMDNLMRRESRPFSYTIGKDLLSRREITVPAGFVRAKGWWSPDE